LVNLLGCIAGAHMMLTLKDRLQAEVSFDGNFGSEVEK
jgi:hypothetical protein